MYPYLDPPPLAFAHRGGAADGDENTAAAFGRAIALGYRYLETDVRATADGVAVLFHDPDLTRMLAGAERPDATRRRGPDEAADQRGSDGGGGFEPRIDRLTWRQLSRIRVAGEPVAPRLDDILDAWPNTRFNLDAKADSAVTPLLEAVERTGARDRILLASFSDARLARMRQASAATVATSLGMREVAALWAAARLRRRRYRPPATAVAVQVPMRHRQVRVVDARFVAYAHRVGLQVHVWTVDDPTVANQLLDLGVDGIMTDRVEMLRDVYAARGLWPPAR